MVGAFTFAVLASFAAIAAAGSVPDNVQNFLQRVKNSGCPNQIGGPFRNQNPSDPDNVYYCQDPATNAVYIKGPDTEFTNMDIDCDGDRSGSADDGRCGGDDTGGNQSDTAFEDEVSQYGIDNLNPYVATLTPNWPPDQTSKPDHPSLQDDMRTDSEHRHSYVVFGADGTDPSFDPTNFGIEHLSTIAVVCNDQLFYGVWGDTNGDDPPVVGEASISLATLCFGDSMSYSSGHDETDVLFIAFPGKNATIGDAGDWTADNPQDFQDSLTALGDKLVAAL